MRSDSVSMSTAPSPQHGSAPKSLVPETPIRVDGHRPACEQTDGVPADIADRLTLRPLLESDRAEFLEIVGRNRAAIGHWVPLHEAGEDDDAFFDRQLRRCAEGDASGRGCRRVAISGGGSIVGLFCLNSISRGLAWEADAVWWIDKRVAGLGVATAGVRGLLAHAFGDMPSGLGLHGVHCGIEPENGASVRVAQKCGFAHKPERKSHLKVGERWVMHEFYLATPESFCTDLG